jgi:hypothetical protein
LTRSRGALLLGLAVASGCATSLPDPESPGARLLTERCGGCHRVYAPSTMTAEMWRYQVERMRALFAQRGLRWLSPAEEETLLGYLSAHAGGGG